MQGICTDMQTAHCVDSSAARGHGIYRSHIFRVLLANDEFHCLLNPCTCYVHGSMLTDIGLPCDPRSGCQAIACVCIPRREPFKWGDGMIKTDLTATDYRQMAGRAGRAGIDDAGITCYN